VLVNLVVNARDAMPQGGKLTIETANVDLEGEYTDNHLGVPNGRYVMLAISDSGCGMDKETQSRIFDPFFTTKEQGKGTGLGLSTVYGIVVQSRGHIWVYSEPDHGSTFKIYLPRIEGRVEDTSTIIANISTPSANVRATVLLVEDDEMVRKLAQVILEKSGFKVLEASAPREALRISSEFAGKIDILVSDVVMPEMSGCDLATAITVSRPDIKILLMSGYTDEAMPRNIMPATGSEFLEKPFSANGLLSKIWELLEAKSPLGLQ
jgi:CheY-like chemotaxis protein